MPELDLSTVVILLAACVGLLFVILLVTIGFSARVGRVERLLAQAIDSREARTETKGSGRGAESRESIDRRPGGPFDSFIAEDPARQLLSKKEQSAAYRKWRQEHGMNWSNS